MLFYAHTRALRCFSEGYIVIRHMLFRNALILNGMHSTNSYLLPTLLPALLPALLPTLLPAQANEI